jgi:hypothetical protein
MISITQEIFLGSLDFLAIAAIVVSLSTLFFTIWNTSRTRRSEQLKVVRELMLNIIERRQVLETVYRKNSRSPLTDNKENLEAKLEAIEWNRSLSDLVFNKQQ